MCAAATDPEHTMPRYTVVWDSDAIDELAMLWMTSSDQQSVKAAADKIDALLSNDPGDKGQAETESLRTLTAKPLGVLFSIRDLDRLVRVLAVRHISHAG